MRPVHFINITSKVAEMEHDDTTDVEPYWKDDRTQEFPSSASDVAAEHHILLCFHSHETPP